MMHLDLALIWAGLLAFAVLAYVVLARLRPRRRHLVSLHARRDAARRDDELGRAGVGRQREHGSCWEAAVCSRVFPLAYAIIMPGCMRP